MAQERDALSESEDFLRHLNGLINISRQFGLSPKITFEEIGKARVSLVDEIVAVLTKKLLEIHKTLSNAKSEIEFRKARVAVLTDITVIIDWLEK